MFLLDPGFCSALSVKKSRRNLDHRWRLLPQQVFSWDLLHPTCTRWFDSTWSCLDEVDGGLDRMMLLMLDIVSMTLQSSNIDTKNCHCFKGLIYPFFKPSFWCICVRLYICIWFSWFSLEQLGRWSRWRLVQRIIIDTTYVYIPGSSTGCFMEDKECRETPYLKVQTWITLCKMLVYPLFEIFYKFHSKI